MHSKDFLITIISWLLLGFLSASIFGAQHHLFERTQSGQLNCKFCKSKEADCVEEICSHALEDPHASVLQSMIASNSAIMTEFARKIEEKIVSEASKVGGEFQKLLEKMHDNMQKFI